MPVTQCCYVIKRFHYSIENMTITDQEAAAGTHYRHFRIMKDWLRSLCPAERNYANWFLRLGIHRSNPPLPAAAFDRSRT